MSSNFAGIFSQTLDPKNIIISHILPMKKFQQSILFCEVSVDEPVNGSKKSQEQDSFIRIRAWHAACDWAWKVTIAPSFLCMLHGRPSSTNCCIQTFQALLSTAPCNRRCASIQNIQWSIWNGDHLVFISSPQKICDEMSQWIIFVLFFLKKKKKMIASFFYPQKYPQNWTNSYKKLLFLALSQNYLLYKGIVFCLWNKSVIVDSFCKM